MPGALRSGRWCLAEAPGAASRSTSCRDSDPAGGRIFSYHAAEHNAGEVVKMIFFAGVYESLEIP